LFLITVASTIDYSIIAARAACDANKAAAAIDSRQARAPSPALRRRIQDHALRFPHRLQSGRYSHFRCPRLKGVPCVGRRPRKPLAQEAVHRHRRADVRLHLSSRLKSAISNVCQRDTLRRYISQRVPVLLLLGIVQLKTIDSVQLWINKINKYK
jgi:hypothetical protein